MADINQVVFSGRLTKDPEIKDTKKGSKLGIATIANNTGYGEHKTCSFIRFMCFKGGAKILSSLKKGDPVTIAGEETDNEYTTKNGEKRRDKQVKAFNIIPGARRNKGPVGGVEDAFGSAQAEPQAEPQAGSGDVDIDDDLPF